MVSTIHSRASNTREGGGGSMQRADWHSLNPQSHSSFRASSSWAPAGLCSQEPAWSHLQDWEMIVLLSSLQGLFFLCLLSAAEREHAVLFPAAKAQCVCVCVKILKNTVQHHWFSLEGSWDTQLGLVASEVSPAWKQILPKVTSSQWLVVQRGSNTVLLLLLNP